MYSLDLLEQVSLQKSVIGVGSHDVLEYSHAIPKQQYFNMVKGCYMSALSSLNEKELREGLIEMERKYRNVEILEFIDHFDYLTANRD